MKKLIRWLNKHKLLLFLFVFILFFPLIVGMIYALPFPQIIAVDSGDLLAYYGTAFGILGSFITYRHEKNKSKKERQQEIKPVFTIKMTSNDDSKMFNVVITNHSKHRLSYLYFYDRFVSENCEKQYSFNVTYYLTIEEEKRINPDFNITMDSDILDKDGYPKYVQLCCEDVDENSWNCCYFKVKDGNEIFYYPRDFEVMPKG